MADMRKCLECGGDVPQTDGKRLKLYCNEACRKTYGRKQAKLAKEIIQEISTALPDTINGRSINGQPLPDKPKCKYCGVELDHPKQVCCGPCAWGRQGYAAHTDQRPLFQSQGLVLTGRYKLTAFEREHYRPASELGVGQHNPVSRPGDSHYG